VSKQTWDVFQQRESWSHFAYDADGFRPEVSVVVFSLSLSCNAEGLAREARSNDIHASTPRLAVECSDVIPYRERFQMPFFLSSHKDFNAIRVDLNRTDCSPSKQF
jgi:hypothetical protein